VLMVFALVPIFLLQRSVIHSHLVTASRHDAKTGLANPAWWRTESGRAVTRAQHGGGSVAVLVVDLDHFKAVNDRHGHLVGDKVLAVVADTIRAVVRPGDLVGRFGGDEFTVLLAAVDELQAVATAERLRQRLDGALRQALTIEDPPLLVTASVGVALFGDAGVELDELLTAADGAMYQAKAMGGNRICLAGSPPGSQPQTLVPEQEIQRPDQQTQSI
jgi:diguanylate cyclase (GGDEF)-like protein